MLTYFAITQRRTSEALSGTTYKPRHVDHHRAADKRGYLLQHSVRRALALPGLSLEHIAILTSVAVLAACVPQAAALHQ